MAGSGTDSNPFGPGLLRFLQALQRNNNREWFEAHKDDYEHEVREPALMFIRIMARHVRKVSPRLRASDKKVGGSLMRIHRDVRFTKDKSPFKTNLGIQFRHEAGKDVHAPGLYFHVAPEEIFLGCGMWRPDPDALKAVRQSILDDPGGWKRVRDAQRFRAIWKLGGSSLKRPPRGYPADHPLVEDLKRTDHIAFCNLAAQALTGAGLIDDVAGRFRRAAAYLRWQARALDLPF